VPAGSIESLSIFGKFKRIGSAGAARRGVRAGARGAPEATRQASGTKALSVSGAQFHPVVRTLYSFASLNAASGGRATDPVLRPPDDNRSLNQEPEIRTAVVSTPFTSLSCCTFCLTCSTTSALGALPVRITTPFTVVTARSAP